MNKRRYTGLKDAKGRKLYERDTIYYKYKDTLEAKGFGIVTGEIVFENAAFVVKEPSYKFYDWSVQMTRPGLLWQWLTEDTCFRKPISRIKNK